MTSEQWQNEFNKLDMEQQWLINTCMPDVYLWEMEKRKEPKKLVIIAKKRIIRTGFKEVCSRCLGTGHYSYNPKDGTICYKCLGQKYTIPKLTKQVKEQIETFFNENVKGKSIKEVEEYFKSLLTA